MNNQSCEQTLRSILWRTINLEQEFPDEFQLYVLPKDDVEFVKKQLAKQEDDSEFLVDALSKLFIAFYFDSILGQIVDNLKSYPDINGQKDKSNEYFLSLAGLLHEVKTALTDYSEVFLPYLTAYEEFIGGSSSTEDTLLNTFRNNIENAIQAVIKF